MEPIEDTPSEPILQLHSPSSQGPSNKCGWLRFVAFHPHHFLGNSYKACNCLKNELVRLGTQLFFYAERISTPLPAFDKRRPVISMRVNSSTHSTPLEKEKEFATKLTTGKTNEPWFLGSTFSEVAYASSIVTSECKHTSGIPIFYRLWNTLQSRQEEPF